MSEKNFLKKGISLWVTVILILLSVLLTFQITYLAVNNKYAKLLDEVSLDQNRYAKLAYIDEMFRTYGIYEIDDKELSDFLVYGYIAGTGDKHAYYYTAEDFATFTSEQDGNFDGIGVNVIYDTNTGSIEIISVNAESPAEKAGLLPGDFITGANGKSVAELGYYGAIYEIKGEKGTYVDITVARPSGDSYETLEFNIMRDSVTNITVRGHMYVGMNSDLNIGIVQIDSFDLITSSQFIETVESLKAEGAEAFVFDVRYNPGGDLQAISKILDYLLPEGPIIRINYKVGEEEVMTSDANHLGMPMAVLVNGSTASAAELFSSAIKDYELGKLVGTTTYGKGTMQMTMPLPDESAVVISIAKYNPPFSDNYDGIGITPDIEVELDEELTKINRYKVADSDDNQLQAAIESLNADYKSSNSAE